MGRGVKHSHIHQWLLVIRLLKKSDLWMLNRYLKDWDGHSNKDVNKSSLNMVNATISWLTKKWMGSKQKWLSRKKKFLLIAESTMLSCCRGRCASMRMNRTWETWSDVWWPEKIQRRNQRWIKYREKRFWRHSRQKKSGMQLYQEILKEINLTTYCFSELKNKSKKQKRKLKWNPTNVHP